MTAAGLLLVITPGFALGAPHTGDLVLDAICVAISREGMFLAKKLCFGREFLAWADLGNHGVVVGHVVGFPWVGHGLLLCLEDVLRMSMDLSSVFAMLMSLLKDRFLILYCNGCLVRSDFQAEAVFFGSDEALVELEGRLFVITTCFAEHLEHLSSVVAELAHSKLEAIELVGQIVKTELL
eukprot:1695224-Ditylum_brightwellii.AAC.1